jgi:NAD(P)-dependent dehydrogenase (short-subunit alcohol dehydrogenase family)
VQRFEPVKLETTGNKTPRLRSRGVYWITGGLGGVGLALATYLARSVKAKLILSGRSSLPRREEWSEWLTSHPQSDGTSRKIREIHALEELGAEVLPARADVVDLNQMRNALSEAEARFGPVNGIIHAAGVVAGAEIQKITPEYCDQQFRPKIKGLIALEQLFRDKPLDFCLLTSSLSSVLGGLGYAGYAAGNLYMDAFAQRHNQGHAARWISVNWDAWRFTDHVPPEEAKSELGEFAICPKEGGEAFQRILSLESVTQVVVSTGGLESRLDKWIRLKTLRDPKSTETASEPLLAVAAVASGALWLRLASWTAVSWDLSFEAIYALASWLSWMLPLAAIGLLARWARLSKI